MKTIFVSGPITGVYNYIDNFNKVCARLEDRYNSVSVINPVDFTKTVLEYNKQPTWYDYMNHSITTMMKVEPDELVVLDGWEKSKGSQAEVYIARNVLDIPVFKYCEVKASCMWTLEPVECEFILTSGVYRINEESYIN